MLPSVSFFGKRARNCRNATSTRRACGGIRDGAVFHDPILTSLAERIADANLDVRTATLRLAESRSQRGVTASAEFPALNGDASYQRDYTAKTVFEPGQTFVQRDAVHHPPSAYGNPVSTPPGKSTFGPRPPASRSRDAQVEALEYQRATRSSRFGGTRAGLHRAAWRSDANRHCESQSGQFERHSAMTKTAPKKADD